MDLVAVQGLQCFVRRRQLRPNLRFPRKCDDRNAGGIRIKLFHELSSRKKFRFDDRVVEIARPFPDVRGVGA